ncbi:MAG: ATP-binding protein [Elusimicrobiota bacterium]|nr:ATP-binding protein [Elusimicrobiota bacterium]
MKKNIASARDAAIRNAEFFTVLEKLNRAKKLSEIGTLTAEIAHELRNPLATIKIAIYNIRHKIDTSAVESHICNIEKKIKEAEQIIDNLLHYSALHTPEYGKVKIYPILKQCVKAVREKYKEKNVQITIRPPDPADMNIEADSVQLAEVFGNILDNACESIGHDRGKIEVRIDRRGRNKVFVVFSDNGCGIKADDIDSVKDPFFTRKTRGTGLGLAVASQIVYIHGGEIKIESTPPDGTSVRVLLPLKRISR